MRYIFLFLTGLCLLPGYLPCIQAQEAGSPLIVTIDKKRAPLTLLFKEIEQQTGMQFTYESSLLTNLPPVSFTATREPLESCLKRLFLNLPIQYQIAGKYIILKRKLKQVTVSGFIRDSQSSESLIGASAYDPYSRKGAASNNDGFFSIRLPADSAALQFSYIGYKSQVHTFPLLEADTTLQIELSPDDARLQEVVVTGTNREKQPVLNTQMGAMEFSQQTIRAMPVMFGEADLIKTLQMTPGVAVGTEGFAGMYVRGGNVDENLFLVDGNPVYQVSHLGGIFSAFNPEAIRGMEFFKGGFPARYGGRLSSVVDVHVKDGNMKAFHGSASLGLIAGNLNIEGPIVKDRTSFMVSLRRTWLDALTAPAIAIYNNREHKYGDKMRGRYAFHDLNVKLNHRFNERSRLFLSLYNGHDKLEAGYDEFSQKGDAHPFLHKTRADLQWGNLLATVGWTYVFNNRLYGKLSGVYTQYNSTMKQSNDNRDGVQGEEAYTATYNEVSNRTGIRDFGFRTAFDYLPSTAHHIRFGGDALMHRFRPEYNRVKGYNDLDTDSTHIGAMFANERLWAKEFSAFAEDDWSLSHAIRLNGGLRYTLFHIDNTTFMSIDPRLSMRWLLHDDLSLKASYARMHQYVHLVTSSYINLPTDAWMPVTERLKPLASDQFSLGAYYNWKGEYDFSVEGYYKRLDNLLEYRDGYSFLPSFSSWEDKMAVGSGRAYGMEVMVRKPVGKTTGWIGYTLSWADREFPDINQGKRFPSKYDNRHKVNIVVQHKLSDKVELSAAWTYASGNRVTLSLENYQGLMENLDNRKTDPEYGGYGYFQGMEYVQERNNVQLPAYHRLDLGINIFRPKKNGRMGIWNISIYNVYNRMNPFMILKKDKKVKLDQPIPAPNGGYGYVDTKYVPCFKWIGIMPIIPSITYTYKF